MIKKYLVFISLSVLCCCRHYDSEESMLINKYGYGMDSVRRSVGLPLMSNHLTVSNIGFDNLIFENLEKTPYPKFVTKCVFWDSVSVYMERNYFYKSDSERLQIYYIFKPLDKIDTIGLCNWYERGRSDSGRFLLKYQADSLLKNWKLKE